MAVLFAACLGQAQSLKLIAVHFPAGGSIPNNILFLCCQKYDQTGCVRDASALRQAMAPYPLQLLGVWSFVLVLADDWKALVRDKGGDPVSPAFSVLDQRATLLEAGLFSGTAGRDKELLQRFGVIGPDLVNLAITLEMGHALCLEKDERRADDYGKELRKGKIPTCGKTSGSKTNG